MICKANSIVFVVCVL